MKLVRVEWVDAHHHSPGEWVDPDDIVPGIQVITVGLLLTTRRKHFTVAQSIDESGNCTGVFSIPRSAVRRLTVLAK